MADPVVIFNSGTGSDTAASGAGPTIAVSGASAAHTNGSASTTITLTNVPSLSGIATDGSAILWLNTSSGRQYSKITGTDDGADTVTVEDSFTIAAGSPVDYAIGGKRATFDHAGSRTLFADAKSAWTIRTETDQAMTASTVSLAGGGSAAAKTILEGDSASTHRVLSNNASGVAVLTQSSTGGWLIRNLKLTHTHSTTKGHGVNLGSTGLTVAFQNVIFGDPTNKLSDGVNSNGAGIYTFIDCLFSNCTDDGANGQNTSGHFTFFGCWFDSNTGAGYEGRGFCTFIQCLFTDNTGDGIINVSTAFNRLSVVNCTFDNNGGDGIDLSLAVLANFQCLSTNITRSGGYGIRCASGQDAGTGLYEDFNNFGTGATANTSGATLNLTQGSNDLAVNPSYTNTGGNDWSVGTSVKAKGFTGGSGRTIGANQSNTLSYNDIGAAQNSSLRVGKPTSVAININK